MTGRLNCKEINWKDSGAMSAWGGRMMDFAMEALTQNVKGNAEMRGSDELSILGLDFYW